MVIAAFSAEIRKGIGWLFLSVRGVLMYPGLIEVQAIPW